MVGMYVLLGIVGLYLSLGYLGKLDDLESMGISPTFGYFLLLILYILINQGLGIAKLRKMELPAAYLRSVYIGAALQLLGLVALIIGMMSYMG